MPESPLRSANILAQTLIDKFISDPQAAEELKANPSQIKTYASNAVQTSDTGTQRAVEVSALALDASVYRIVVIALGGCVVGSVFSILVIAVITVLRAPDPTDVSISIPDGLVALASAAVGALAGLLTPVGRSAVPADPPRQG